MPDFPFMGHQTNDGVVNRMQPHGIWIVAGEGRDADFGELYGSEITGHFVAWQFCGCRTPYSARDGDERFEGRGAFGKAHGVAVARRKAVKGFGPPWGYSDKTRFNIRES